MDEIIVTKPELYFYTQKLSFEQRLENVKLTKDEENAIVTSKTVKTIRDKTLGLFKLGDIVNTVLNWNEEIDKDIKEAKKEFLLSRYFEKQDQVEFGLNQLKNLLTDPVGNTLFNKILRILDNSAPDVEQIEHLTKSLQYIVSTDFKSMFEDHKYALNQIEMLTPQALTILSDYGNWPSWRMQSFSSNNGLITSDWLPQFVSLYSGTKNITDDNLRKKVSHSMNDLIKNRYIEAKHMTNDLKDNFASIEMSEIGRIVVKYVM